MADVETAIYSRLAGFAALTALVNTRIYPVIAEQGAANPLIVFNVINERVESAMGVDLNPVEASIRVSIYANEADGAMVLSVKNEVKNALQRYSGTSGGVVVQDIFYEGQRADFDAQTKEHRRDLDFRVFFEE